MATQDSRELSEVTERWWLRNMVLNAVVDFGFGFGLSLLAVGTIIAVFLKHLGASNTVVGLAPALSMVCAALTQLPATHWTRHLREKKKVFVALHIAAYLPWLVIGALAWRWGETHPHRMIVALLVLMGTYALVLGSSPPLWGQLLPRLFPDRKRGMAVGIIILAQGIAGVLGGLFAAHVLAQRPFPLNFATLFLTAGVCMVLARSLHLLSVESVPEEPPEAPSESAWSIARDIWRSDRRLRRFILARYIYESGGAVGNFFAVFALAKFHLGDQAAGQFALAASLGMGLIAPFLGRLGDVRGYRRVMGWAMVIQVCTTALVLAAPDRYWMYAVFLLAGIAGAADGVAYVNLLVEMGDEKRRGYYIALGFTAMAPLRLAAPLFWGAASDRLTPFLTSPASALALVFAWGILFQALGWVALVMMVDDPRRPRQRILHWKRGMVWPEYY